MYGSPKETPWGAQHPITPSPPTTDDDLFEDRSEADLRRWYQEPVLILRCKAVPWRSTYLRPDFRVWLDGVTFEVSDAKRRQRLGIADVLKVGLYKRATGAQKASIYVPQACRVSRPAQAALRLLGIELRKI